MLAARKRSSFSLVLSLTLLVLAAAAPALAHDPSASPGHTVSQEARARRETLTTDLVRLNVQYRLAASGQKPRLEQDLMAASLNRKQEMLGLIDSDPGEFLRLAIPAAVRAGMPLSVQKHVEQEMDIEGTLEILHEDDASGGRYLHHLETVEGRFALHFAGEAPDHLLTGAHVRVKGVRLEQALVLDGSGASIQLVTPVIPNTLGAQKTLVILVNFPDKPIEPYSVDAARSIVFATTSDWDMQNSYGQTWLEGDVVGWYTIPLSAAICDHGALASYAKQAAAAAGVNVSSYVRHVFAFPGNACSWWGLGTVGGKPSSAWINGSLQLTAMGHEMGHNFGLYHSHSYECGGAVLGSACTVGEYGDAMDIMGSSSGHFNAFQKERLGWLNYGDSPTLLTVTANGSFTIDSYETATTRPKGLKFVQSVNASTGQKTWYYVEHRQGISNPNVQNGVLVHLATEGAGNTSYLLDMTPETSSWSDPALVAGRSFTDPDSGVTIMTTSVGSGGATVSVAFTPAACMRGTPTVALSPSQSQWMHAGTSAAFTVAVTNHDNDGCGASLFSLQDVVPAGWTGVLGTPSLALDPGATVSTTLNVTSPSAATDGFYSVGVSVSDTVEPVHVGSGSGSYVVMSALDAVVSVTQSVYTRPASVSISTLVRSNGSPVSGASVVVNVTSASGSTTKLTATTGAYGVATVKLSLKRHDPVGAYHAAATASMGSSVTAPATTTFQVR